MKEQIKTPKIEQSNEVIDNQPLAEFKTLVIRKLQNWLNLVANYMKNEGYAKRDKGQCTGN